jgi:AMP deaminase
MEDRRSFYSALGPPDPIDYLRRAESRAAVVTSSSSSSLSRLPRRHQPDDEEEDGQQSLRPGGQPKEEDWRRYDSDEDLMKDLLVGDTNDDSNAARPRSNVDGTAAAAASTGGGPPSAVEQEPPARERPSGDAWPYRETLSFTRGLIFYGSGSITRESQHACYNIIKARRLRQKYFGGNGCSNRGDPSLLRDPNLRFRVGSEGVVELYLPGSEYEASSLVTVPTIDSFSKDYNRLVEMVSEGGMRSFCFQRLQMLSTSFKMHNTINSTVEREEQSNLLGTDFYRTMKIDNHIHAAAAPTARTFVEFVRRKLETEGDTVVVSHGQKTLRQVFNDAGLDMDHLTIDAFNVLADYSVYQRFDQFNQKYSPFALADMRRIFLKTTNAIDGGYFAELLKIVINRHEQAKGHVSACEMRLSIYGMERHEWHDLAKWMLRDWKSEDCPGPMVSTHNRWLVQIPRLWRIYSTKPVDEPGQAPRSFVEMIENIFVPLFEATLNPDDHPEIAQAMTHIVGFDSVDDEGVLEESCSNQRPHEWTTDKNPSFWWQLYFLWANMEVLNHLRQARGLNTFSFRPHAGETGDPMHLAATYLLCQSINHGILLDMQVSLQYLYYLDQIGLSISPLSNNFLFRKIAENPFPKFFRRSVFACEVVAHIALRRPLSHNPVLALLQRFECNGLDRRPALVPHVRRRPPGGVLRGEGHL